jgi:hypothetical protein
VSWQEAQAFGSPRRSPPTFQVVEWLPNAGFCPPTFIVRLEAISNLFGDLNCNPGTNVRE